ncbi:MAG TPA: endonuclease Q family protein [Candidatus Krumholzibacteriaceae bacterium]|nr:endonuclease Q family protein [Candidatus Krumholzibacteriaceae bacterium]
MRIIADLHMHSRFSRATSAKMNVKEIARFARKKGLSVVGTGDFSHPRWLKELTQDLAEVGGTGLYKSSNEPESPVHFMVTNEVSTIFTFEGKAKKVHHVILTSNLETAAQINERLARYGDLAIDGRPMLNMTAPQLVEEVMQVSSDNMVFPAHAWTPWFGVFGAFSGFDRMEDCYQDMTKHIRALETGLSSDPPMNWRLSALDRFTLVSNSDSHSHWPWRIGREANAFELEKVTYEEIVDTIRKKDSKRFKFTIETDPAYGKYHWTGHRNCNVSMPPQEAIKHGNICPVCSRRLTKGVEQRVEELADRQAGYEPEGAIGFRRLLPLSEIIAAVIDVSNPSVQGVWEVYNKLTENFTDEYTVLIDAKREDMARIVEPRIADAIVNVREGKIHVTPGYDGVYGQPVFSESEKPLMKREEPKAVKKQTSLFEFL